MNIGLVGSSTNLDVEFFCRENGQRFLWSKITKSSPTSSRLDSFYSPSLSRLHSTFLRSEYW